MFDPTAGDPRSATLTTLANGTIIAAVFVNLTSSFQAHTIRSTDNGATWDSPVRVLSDALEIDTISVEGPVVELSNGHLLLALRGTLIGGIEESAMLVRSTDGGDTWADVAVIADGDTVGMSVYEPNLLRLLNGDLYCALRTESEHIAFTTSTDNGATWYAITVLTHRSNGRPSVIQAVNGDLLWMSRWNGRNFFQVSTDNGRTFGSVVAIGAPGFRGAYSQMVAFHDGRIGAAFAMEPVNALKAEVFYATILEEC